MLNVLAIKSSVVTPCLVVISQKEKSSFKAQGHDRARKCPAPLHGHRHPPDSSSSPDACLVPTDAVSTAISFLPPCGPRAPEQVPIAVSLANGSLPRMLQLPGWRGRGAAEPQEEPAMVAEARVELAAMGGGCCWLTLPESPLCA